jgi:peptide/nickel transport system ATP-binding protein
MTSQSPLLLVQGLSVAYPRTGRRAAPKLVLEDVHLELGVGRTLGLVGESGSGKSTLGRALLGLAPVTAGEIHFNGENITHAGLRERRRLSRDLQVVFQDPFTSLNPSMYVGDILAEPLRVQGWTRVDAASRIRRLLDQVGLPSDSAQRRPREFSGGQRQRVAIARALALSPKLIVCDEPVSALDLSTQARVLDLFLAIQRESAVSYLFISHDLDVVRHMSHDVAVMYGGRIVENGSATEVTEHPQHPYTQELLLSSPVPDPDEQAARRQTRARLRASASVGALPEAASA